MRKSILVIFVLFISILLLACSNNNNSNEIIEYEELVLHLNEGRYKEDAIFNIKSKEVDIKTRDYIYMIDNTVTIDKEKIGFYRIFIVKEKDNIYKIVDILIENDSWAKATSDYDYVILSSSNISNKDDFSNFEKTARSFKSKGKYIKLEEGSDYLYTCFVYDKKEYAEQDESVSIEKEELFYLPSLVKEGYEFRGWYKNSNLSGDTVEEYTATDNTNNEFYAAFDLIEYKIVYHLDEGTSCEGDLVNTYSILSSDITLNSNIIKEGFVFDGWYANSDFSGLKIDVIKAHSYGDINLYPKWIKEEIHEMTASEKVDQAIINISALYKDVGRIEEDIKLVEKDEETDCSITWSSSKQNRISNKGKYTRDYQNEVVTLSANVSCEDVTKTFTIEITAIGFKDINKIGIASSYIYRNYSTVDDNFFDTLDIINCAFATCNSDAELTGANFFKVCKEHIIPRAHEKGVWVVMSIAPESAWVEVCNPSNGKVEKFADNIVKAINEYGFDGIDIDWECPTDSQKTWFTNLAKIVNEKVKKNNRNHIVSAAIGGGRWQPPRYDMVNSVKYLDFVNMMTYGMTSSSGQYHNSLYKNSSYHDSANKVGYTLVSCSIVESIEIYDSYNVPHKKIIVGLAFYGIKQSREYDEASKTYSSWGKGGSIFYTSIKNNYLDNPNYTYVYDERCGVPYIISKDKTIFISFDDTRSIKEKCNYILAKKIGGVMYWENGCDTTGDLLGAIGEVLNKA